MRRSCLAFIMLGVIACGSEYIPKNDYPKTSNETGGAVGTTATGGVGATSSVAPAQGGALSESTTEPVGIGAAGGAPVSTGGSATASGGSTGSPSTEGVAGATTPADVVSCGLPPVATGLTAKPSGAPGNLKILNWAGFRGAVSFTLDDAMQSQISHYAELQALGVPFTFFLWTSKAEAGNPIWAQALKDGHELGNHSTLHTQLAEDAAVEQASTFIQSRFGVRAWSLAAPYGDMSYAQWALGKFLLNRGVWEGLVMPNGSTSQFNLPCTIPEEGATAKTMNVLVDGAQSAGGWRIILVHGFKDVFDGAYKPVEFTEFASTVIHAKSLGDMWSGTMASIGAYWVGQKVISPVQPTTVGSDLTYSWTLPDPFPPGKCVRATVSGGTVKQGGRVLEWDSHGYYEISLDAGSVTISP